MNNWNETADFLKEKGMINPEIGIVLGTGLGKLIDHIDQEVVLEYENIPNFPVSTVEFHKGKLIYGTLRGKKVLAMQGRFHYYEGYTAKEITFPIRVMKVLGVKNLILSNAAGGMNLNYRPGDIMVIDDHINLLPDNPLFGKNNDDLGPRFPDMSRPYHPKMNELIHSIASEKNIPIHEGVYVAVGGPNLETRAEYRFLRTIGADVVGMSTVPEVIVANHMSMPCCALSVVTDMCDPDNLEVAKIENILKYAAEGEERLLQIVPELVEKL
ncbi:purine-nucleoside phosphorylase [bacterium SCSIO 12741]|nr:purine-nucleoside phosphorylase [bacterium SCSIO 12741]